MLTPFIGIDVGSGNDKAAPTFATVATTILFEIVNGPGSAATFSHEIMDPLFFDFSLP